MSFWPRTMSAKGAAKGHSRRGACRVSLTALIVLFVWLPCQVEASQGLGGRRLLQGPAPFASLGPQPDLPGPSLEAVLDLWGIGLLPFGLEMQQTLLNVLNETIVDANEDELQLLAVEELLPLSGPSSVSVNGNRSGSQTRSEAPATALAPSTGRRLLLHGPGRRLLQALAAAGDSSNLANLPHLEVRVRIAAAPGQSRLIQQETITAVNGPLLPRLKDEGVNVTFIQLTALSLNYGNGTSNPFPQGQRPPPNPRPSRLSDAAIGLIAAAAVVVGMSGLVAAFIFFRRRNRAPGSPASDKSIPNGSLTSVQADSSHTPPSGTPPASLLFTPGTAQMILPYSHSNSLASSRSSQLSGDGFIERGADGASAAAVDATLFGVPFSELQFSRVIGEGSFGRVFLGKWRETTVAIKILNTPGGPLPDDSWDLQDLTQLKDASWCERQQGPSLGQQLLVEELRKEATLMASLRHPNIVMFLGVSGDPPCMVTEFCARGSLLDVLHRARTNKSVAVELDWRRRLRLLLDAAKGMLYLHSRQPAVLHRDLKSANLLVDKHWQVKVADFNLSRVMQPSAAVSSLAATNPRWLPPEVLSGSGYGASVDVYAFGVIMWELLTWRVPWEDDTPWQVVISVVDHDRRPQIPRDEDLPGSVPASRNHYFEVMQSCWATRPEDRPAFADIIGYVRSMIEAEDTLAAERLNIANSLSCNTLGQQPPSADQQSSDSTSKQ